jgi:iron complex transport system permease protein
LIKTGALKTSEQKNSVADNLSGSKARLIFTSLLLLLVLFFILDIFLGSVSIKPAEVLNTFFSNSHSGFQTIILKFRLPKAITALIVGIALSLSGLQIDRKSVV